MIASKLKPGDEIRVIAPSRNLTEVRQDVHHHAVDFWEREGFRLTFSKNSREVNQFHSSSIAARVEDIHEAFRDPNVKMIITCLGGFNANQLLRHLDFDLIAKNPKILCGYSDITALLNAIYAKTGLVTYHGPHFSTFGFDKQVQYTRKAFFDCVKNDAPFVVSPSETAGKYHTIQEGTCEGTIIGGNLCTLNLLQGTPYMPDIRNKVLFLEDDNIMGPYFCYEFDRAKKIVADPRSALKRYVNYFDTYKGIRVANICGSCGKKAVPLALLGAEVCVFDISEENKRYALELADATEVQIDYQVGDVLEIDMATFGGTFDVVFMEGGVLHYFHDIEQFMDIMNSLLKPGGKLICSDFHPFSKVMDTLDLQQPTMSYFSTDVFEGEMAHARFYDKEVRKQFPKCSYRKYTVSEIINAVIGTGFILQRFDEHPSWANPSIPGEFTIIAVK